MRIFHIFKLLSARNEVYVFFLKESEDDVRAAKEYVRRGVIKGFSYIDALKGFSQIRNPFAKAIKRKFPRYQRLAEQAVQKLIKEKNIDLLHIHLLPMGLMLANLSSFPSVLDLTDSVTLYAMRMFFPLRKPTLPRFFLHLYILIRAMWNETYVLRKYKVTTVVSPTEQLYLRKLNRRANIQVIQNGVDITISTKSTEAEEHPSIIFFGNMKTLPNIDGALYLANEILPLIKQKVPGVKLYIVGAEPPKIISELGKQEGIVVTGFVDDISEYISKASVTVIPMRMGCGLLNKILEAMAHEKPVVTTPIGAESFVQSVKDCLRIGEGPRELAEKTVELLTNQSLRKDLGRKSSKEARTRYTWKTIADKYERLYKQIIKSNR